MQRVAICKCLKGAQREEHNLVGIESNVEEKARLVSKVHRGKSTTWLELKVTSKKKHA